VVYKQKENVVLKKKKERKCGIYLQWSIIQPQKRMKFCHSPGKWMKVENRLSEVQKDKGGMFSLICGR
jgi:hypothetical protein